MSHLQPDAGELLVPALDQVVGGIALARYAAGRTDDAALKHLFRRLVISGEAQEQLLRRYLAGHLETDRASIQTGVGLRRRLAQVTVGLLGIMTGLVGTALLIRWLHDDLTPEGIWNDIRQASSKVRDTVRHGYPPATTPPEARVRHAPP
jgi:hypothetical protein